MAEGTTAILLTGAGDDLISVAGSAQIDGGEGHDIVTLTGHRDEWQKHHVGAVQIYTRSSLVEAVLTHAFSAQAIVETNSHEYDDGRQH